MGRVERFVEALVGDAIEKFSSRERECATGDEDHALRLIGGEGG